MPAPAFKKFISLFGIAMVAFYLTAGYLLMFKLNLFPNDPMWNKGFGTAFILYAIFRGYRIYAGFKEADIAEEE